MVAGVDRILALTRFVICDLANNSSVGLFMSMRKVLDNEFGYQEWNAKRRL